MFEFVDCGCGCKGAIAKKRFMISILSALVFFLIINKDTFKLTRSLFGNWIGSSDGCPSTTGFLLHSMVFGVVIFSLMFGSTEKSLAVEEKMKVSLFSALLFYVIANPALFKGMNRLLGGWVSDNKGCATIDGSILHTIVFLGVSYAVMNGKRI
jgi:hypothetical protein